MDIFYGALQIEIEVKRKSNKKKALDKNFEDISVENEMSENSEDDDDATEEALFRIGNQTVKKTRVLNSSKKIQKR